MTRELEQTIRRIKKETPEFSDGAEILASVVKTLKKQGRLPNRLPEQTKAESAEKPRDLVQETFNLLGNLREPIAEEREVFEQKGYVFITIEAKPLGEVLDENEEYFGFVDPSKNLSSYTPPQTFGVAINPNKLRIERSNNSSQAQQLRMIEEHLQKEIKSIVPDAKAIMLPATGYAQADIQFQKENDGKKLLPDFYARALDTTVGSNVADVGRPDPDDQLDVYDWGADDGADYVWAVPALVFLRK